MIPIKVSRSSLFSRSHPKQMLIKNAKQRAKARGLPFNLKPGDFRIPLRCPVLHIPLKRGIGRGNFSGNSPSLDRLIPKLGYVKGNILVVSWRANSIRGDATVAELELVSKFYKRILNDRTKR